VFDVGFSELVLIALLALLLLGPQRLPEVARAAGKWMARLRNFVNNVKQDFDREMRGSELEELRKLKQELDETRRVIQESSGKMISGISAELSATAAAASLTANAPATTAAPPTIAPPVPPPVSESSSTAAEPAAPARAGAPKTRRRPAATKKKHGRSAKARKPAN
jgi:sec-independent protein translocase protein TatB